MTYDSIKKQRLLIAENIIKSFQIGDDDIEKAQWRAHKYVNKRLNPKTGKIVYEYITTSDIKRISGKKKIVPSKKGGGMEITIDKKGKTLLRYDEEDIQETYDLLSRIPNVKSLKRRTSSKENTQTDYLNFKLNGQYYKIRMSDHSRKTDNNSIIIGIEYDLSYDEWHIDASIGRYKPNDVATIVQNIDAGIRKYKSGKENEKLTSFVTEELDNMEDYESETLYDVDILHIAKNYMNKKRIQDDKYGTQFQAIYYSVFAITKKLMRLS